MRRFRDLLQEDTVPVGHLVMEFATPGIGHLLAGAGCDFAALDMEHSGIGLETLRALIRYCEAAGLPTIVRPPSSDAALVAQVLDAGAQGVMLPMVESAAQAETLVAAARYAPRGRRGFASGIAHDRYRPGEGPLSQRLAQVDAATVVLAIIESAAGLERVEAIAGTEGIDGLIVGHGDLAVSLGQADIPGSATMTAAQARIVVAGRARGLPVGAVCNDDARGRALIDDGIGFLISGSDIGVYRDALTGNIERLRKALAGGA